MPHVVTDHCRLCLFTDCVEHCPVQCFHADSERNYIDPDVCIDCGACIPRVRSGRFTKSWIRRRSGHCLHSTPSARARFL